jgi:hypothetical protein
MLTIRLLQTITLFIIRRTNRENKIRITKILTLTATPRKIRLNAQSEAIEPISQTALVN